MTETTMTSNDPRMRRAITEIKAMIADRYPSTTFSVDQGFDPDGIYITATVDVDNTDEIYDLVIHRLGQFQVEEGLPLYLSVVQTPERLARLLAEHQARTSHEAP